MKTFLVLADEQINIKVRGKTTAGQYTVTLRVGKATKTHVYLTPDKAKAIHTAEVMFFTAQRTVSIGPC